MRSETNMGWNIIHLDETDSTNRYLRELPADDDFVAVTAGYQTAGRGQGSNSWESERGKNLLLSLRIRSTMVAPAQQFVLSMAGALALKSALDDYTDGISLKWPNDVYWKDRKISGTLIETSVADNMLKTCIFGIGININQEQFLSDAPNPVSLRQILGREIAIEEVFEKVLKGFEKEYLCVERGDYDDISTRYHQALYRRTGYYPFCDKDGIFDAEIVCVRPTGHVRLRDRYGKTREYAFKEVTYII